MKLYSKTSRYFVALAIVFIFIPGPSYSLGPLNLRIFDILFIGIGVFVAGRVYRNPYFMIPKKPLLFGSASLYLFLAVMLPIAGFLIYSYPIGYIVGDFRWIQTIVLCIAILAVSENQKSVLSIFATAFKVVLIIQFFLVFLQIIYELSLYNTLPILELFIDNPDFHIDRYGGAGTISSLGTTGAVGFVVFTYTKISERKNGAFILLSLFLLIASGHRTSIVAVIGITVVLIFIFLDVGHIQKVSIPQVAVSSFVGILGFYVLYFFNIGRIRTSDRYYEIFGFLIGEYSFHEISGRGGERWVPFIETVQSSYAVGTLANPSWVLQDLPTIDGYFVMTILQGGPIFFLSFILLILVLGLESTRNILSQRQETGYMVIGLLIIITITSLTQNFMTSIHAKFLLALCIIIILYPE